VAEGGGLFENVILTYRRWSCFLFFVRRLLVLDLDYTLFDCKGTAENISELSRPFLHEFLTACHAHYDIVIWSQTSWRWLEAKITELGMLTHPRYKLAFVLDRTAMFRITSRKGREQRTHEVKALEVIWRKWPGRWGPKNTVHIDDLGRNFALNPQSGLKIAPFKNAHTTFVFFWGGLSRGASRGARWYGL